jgi:hypothetical protein
MRGRLKTARSRPSHGRAAAAGGSALQLREHCRTEVANSGYPAANSVLVDRSDLMVTASPYLLLTISSVDDLMPPFHQSLQVGESRVDLVNINPDTLQ